MKTDNNELIAEFMGGEDAEDKGNPYQYDKYWDRLMPVVEKITPLAKDMGQQAWFDVKYPLMYAHIDIVYKRVLDFVKWYNSNLPHR